MDGKLSVKAFAKATSIVWGLGVLTVGLVSLVRPGYGSAFLNLLMSVYPGDHGVVDLSSVLILTVIAFIDGAIGGLFFAWVYNKCLACCSKSS